MSAITVPTREEQVERFILLDAISTFLAELQSGPPDNVYGPSILGGVIPREQYDLCDWNGGRDELCEELWPEQVDIEALEYCLAEARAELLVSSIFGAIADHPERANAFSRYFAWRASENVRAAGKPEAS
jgi:hypothetical protein